MTGQGRCGSNLLKFALKSHPQIEMIGEYYNPRVFPQARDLPGNQRAREYFRTAGETTRAIGFKIFSHHATSAPSKSVWRYLTTKRVSVVHLIRRNSFERLMSLEVAAASQAWVANESTGELHGAVRLNRPPTWWLERIEADILRDRDLQATFAGNEYLRIAYEDLAADPQTVFHAVEAFLGVPEADLPLRLEKQERVPKAVRCENYAELVSFFEGTKYAWMLDD